MKTAFVTGGTGFIGLNLIERLCHEGWQVTALHRPTSDLTYIGRFPVELREGSITDLSSLETALPKDTDVVFHVAGDLNMWSKNNARQSKCNVHGTRKMVNTALKKGVRRFVHTSSVAAWGIISGKVTEETPQNGRNSWINYQKTKWAAEQEALKGLGQGLEVIVVNPVAVAGPYDLTGFGRLFMALKERSLLALPDGKLPLAHVHEVAKAHVRAAETGQIGERYILSGEESTWEDFLQEVTNVMGVPCTSRKIPVRVLKTIARLWDIASRLTGNEPELTPESAYLMTGKSAVYCGDKAISELGYQVLPMKQAVRDSYGWLVKESHL